MSTCTAEWRTPEDTLAECGIPATAILVAGCEHQHVQDSPGCAMHLAMMHLLVSRREMICVRCEESREPHECTLILLREDPLPA